MDVTRLRLIIATWRSASRRRFLSRVTTGALATSLGLAGSNPAVAKTCRQTKDCPGKKVCRNRACVKPCPQPGVCGDFPDCQGTDECFCAKTPAKTGLCVQSVIFPGLAGCNHHSDCPKGLVCATGCCGSQFPEFVCQPPCGTPLPESS
jgi:hypothetical protein